MSKKVGAHPTAGEANYVQHVLLRGEPPLWMRWVTKRKREKVQDRLIVVGNYRIFSIKKTLTGKKQVQRVGHFFDLVSINSGEPDKLLLKFKEFELFVQEPTAGTELIKVIWEAFQKISCNFAQYAIPQLNITPADRAPQLIPIDFGPSHGFIDTYKAFCDYYNLAPSMEFIKYVNDICNSGNTELIMEQCPGTERKEGAIDFTPIRAALRHNTYFTSFVLRNIPRKELALCIADTLLHNVTLTKIVISGVETPDSAIFAIGTALRKNLHNRILELDFSSTPTLRDKGCIGLAEGIQAMTHGLTKINLAACNIGIKGITALFQALSFSQELGASLVDLDLSYNNINVQGSIAIASYFHNGRCGNRLQNLILSNCRLDVGAVLKGAKNGQITSLVQLDISGNRIDSSAGQALAIVLEQSLSLNLLNISSCGLQPSTMVSILSALGSNLQLHDVTLNLSGNDLGPVGAANITSVLIHNTNIKSIILKTCGFKKEGLLKLSDALLQNTSLQALDISYNFHAGNATKMRQVVESFGQGIAKHPRLEHLAIKGDGNKLAIGAEIRPIFDALAQNPNLTELDISGNKIGDQLGVHLCDCLRNNNHLRYLSWDQNQISIGGWQALLNLLSQNKTLVHCTTPKFDLDRAIKDTKNREVFENRAKDCLDKIQSGLKRNLGGVTVDYESQYEKSKRGRSYTVKPDYQTTETDMNSYRPKSSIINPNLYDQSQNQTYTQNYDQPHNQTYTQNYDQSYDQTFNQSLNNGMQSGNGSHVYSMPDDVLPPPSDWQQNSSQSYEYDSQHTSNWETAAVPMAQEEFDDVSYENSIPFPPLPPPPF